MLPGGRGKARAEEGEHTRGTRGEGRVLAKEKGKGRDTQGGDPPALGDGSLEYHPLIKVAIYAAQTPLEYQEIPISRVYRPQYTLPIQSISK